MAPPRTKTGTKSATAEPKAVSKKTASSADTGAPKRPLNSYMIYVRENREALREAADGKNMIKAAAEAWKKLDDKSKWEQMAKDEKERYEREFAAYKAGGSAAH